MNGLRRVFTSKDYGELMLMSTLAAREVLLVLYDRGYVDRPAQIGKAIAWGFTPKCVGHVCGDVPIAVRDSLYVSCAVCGRDLPVAGNAQSQMALVAAARRLMFAIDLQAGASPSLADLDRIEKKHGGAIAAAIHDCATALGKEPK